MPLSPISTIGHSTGTIDQLAVLLCVGGVDQVMTSACRLPDGSGA
jgi:hypothetical protein